jgi:hypothetical protein
MLSQRQCRHAAMLAMLQCPQSNTARFRERRAEGQSVWGQCWAMLTTTPKTRACG